MSQILANKYRPKKLSDVIGQEVVVKCLQNSLKNKSMHHAYIFEGIYGTGKTTVARILAATENCLAPISGEPCGECSNCKAIFSSKSVDVKELDAASNRSVDDIRDIQDDVRRAGITCKVRYIVIDEAHSLTGIAAEAALKMIEEPPPNVRFVLCTTDAHKLKDTIHSRCISFKFNKISWHDLSSHLKNIAEKEKITINDEALKSLAKTSKGSVRNSLQSLEKVISFAGDSGIEESDVASVLGVSAGNIFFHLFDAISRKDASKGYKVINNVCSYGQQISQIVESITDHLGNLLLIKSIPEESEELDFTDDELKKYQYQTSQFDLEHILYMIGSLTELNKAIYFNVNAQRSLEAFMMNSIIWKN